MAKCLAFDAALLNCGWAALETVHVLERRVIAYGVIKTSPGKNPARQHGRRLALIYAEAVRLIDKYQPDSIAIEAFFIGQNAEVGMTLNRVTGVLILAAEGAGLPVYEYKPAKWKAVAIGAGGANKETIQFYIQSKFGLDETPPSDAADAIGIGECHLATLQGQGLA